MKKRFLMILFVIGIAMCFSTGMAYAQSNEGICITELERVSWDRYTGNVGDSRLNVLGEPREYGYGNTGVDGTIYENGFEAWIARWNGSREISWVTATYKLNGAYNILSGNTGLINSYNTNDFDTTIYFYGDGELLYSTRMTPGDWKHSFSFSVAGVNALQITVKDNVAKAGGTSFAIYDLFLAKDTTVKFPTFKITINGVQQNNAYREYPFITYRDITYFPMTFDDCLSLGVVNNWSEDERCNRIYAGGLGRKYNAPKTSQSQAFNTAKAQYAPNGIYVNDEKINNGAETYPILLYKNVLYFPMTWRWTSTFGWDNSFDSYNGLSISTIK